MECQGVLKKNARFKIQLASILAILAIRFLLICLFTPRGIPNTGDTGIYYTVAKRLAQSPEAWTQPGSEFGYRAPLYFAYLAGIYHLAPEAGYWLGQCATAIIGVLTCLIVYRLSESYGGVGRGPMVAFLIRGIAPFFLVADTFVLTEPLSSCLLMGAMLVFLSTRTAPKLRSMVGLGVLVGLSMLTREAATGYPVIFGVGVWLAGGSIQKRVLSLCTFIAIIVIVLLPWMYRNQVVWGRLLPLYLTAGPNLHVGNNPNARGLWSNSLQKPPDNIRYGTPEDSNWHREQAIRFIKAHPTQFVQNGFRKIAWLIFPTFHYDKLTSIYNAPTRLLAALSVLCGGASAMFILLGLGGFIMAKRDRLWWLCLALIMYHVTATFVTFGDPRFRDPIDHILIYFVSAHLTNWRDMWRELRSDTANSRWQARVLAVMFTYVLANWSVVFLMKLRGSV